MSMLHGKSLCDLTLRLAFTLALIFSVSAARAQGQTQAASPSRETTTAQARPASNDAAASLLMQLNLKPEQIEQMKEIRRQSAPEAAALIRRRNQARRALDEALYSDALDESLIGQRAGEVAEAQAAVVRLEAQTQLRVRRVLTTEQVQMFRGLRQRAQRRQRIERRLERGVNPDESPRENINRRLNQRPDLLRDGIKDVRPDAPADGIRNSRPFALPRARRRRP
ncbi:MAG: Spy/CpxP family protein refolding chaperone [Pyrinomonadaceae bacterium]